MPLVSVPEPVYHAQRHMAEQQSLQHHTRWDPAFHFFLAPMGLIIIGFTIYHLTQGVNVESVAHVIIAIWAVVAVLTIRNYSLKVQDRVIRLEERLRMEKLLPESLRPRCLALTERQLIALRFASDAELPSLVEKTFAGNLEPKAIKQEIKTWRPDYWRV
jgi:hypothetical protein